MKKQIIYPDFISRIFSTALDLSLFALVAIPILQFCFFGLMIFFYNDYFHKYNIDLHNQTEVIRSVMSQEFYEYLKAGNFNKYILFNITIFLTNLTVIGSYFIGFWYYKGATIGKIFMRMKIVDAITFARPTFKQLIKRFLGYITFPIGIFFILFSSQKQALHDKIAGTVVIKA